MRPRALAFALVSGSVVAVAACGARSSLDLDIIEAPSTGTGGGGATGAPASGGATTSVGTAGGDPTTAASSSTGTPDPELCNSIVWSGEPVDYEPSFDAGPAQLASRPLFLALDDGTTAMAFATGQRVASLTFDAWSAWPPALPPAVEHASFAGAGSQSGLAPAAPGAFVFARGEIGNEYVFGRATVGVAGSELDPVVTVGLGLYWTRFLVGPAFDDGYLVGVGDVTRTFGKRLIPGVPLDVVVEGGRAVGCSSRENQATAIHTVDGFVAAALVDDAADDCEVAPDPNPSESATFVRVIHYDDAANVVLAYDIDTGARVESLALVGAESTRLFWRNEQAFFADLDGDDTVEPGSYFDDDVEVATITPWREGFIAIKQRYTEADGTEVEMQAYGADGAHLAGTPPLGFELLGTQMPFGPVHVSPDGRMFLWGGRVQQPGGARFMLFRAECR